MEKSYIIHTYILIVKLYKIVESCKGRKELQPKMLYQVHFNFLEGKDNFYRRWNEALYLHFLYPTTSIYYGEEGQERIDPMFYLKIGLIGYLNNINDDGRLIE